MKGRRLLPLLLLPPLAAFIYFCQAMLLAPCRHEVGDLTLQDKPDCELLQEQLRMKNKAMLAAPYRPKVGNSTLQDKPESQTLQDQLRTKNNKSKSDQDHQSYLFKSAMEAVQRGRQYTLERGCEKTEGVQTAPDYQRYNGSHPIRPIIYFSAKYKVMFCEVAKSGSTEFKLALLDMENILLEKYEQNRPLIPEVARGPKTLLQKADNVTKVKEMFETFYKIMIVRDPFERLVSAFGDKLKFPGNAYYGLISKRIRRHFHPECKHGELASFEDFVDYLLEENGSGKDLDIHWNLYTRGCAPCAYKYDYIANLETIEKDATVLREILGLNNDTSREVPVKFFVGANDQKSVSTTSRERVKEAFLPVPRDKIERLYEMYKADFEIFGYPYPKDIFANAGISAPDKKA